MKTTAISIRLVFLIFLVLYISNPALALNFTFSAPSEVNQLQEFSVKINHQEEASSNYDVKIYVHDDVKKYSEIFYEGKWKSPFNYLKSVFPGTFEFKLRANYTGETKICVKLRNSEKNSEVSEICNPITVLKIMDKEEINPKIQDSKQKVSKNKDVKKEKEESTNFTEEPKNQINYTFLVAEQTIQKNKKTNEKIILNPTNKSEGKKIKSSFSTKQDYLRLGIIYGFTFFCIIIIILLSLKKL